MSELSELYLSNTLKTLAVALINVFVPIYLYDLGYNLQEILLFYVIFFGIRPPNDLIAGLFVSYFGPKHVMRASYVTTLISMAMLVTLVDVNWPLSSIAVVSSIGWSFYWLSYHTDFSKIKHTKAEGKELGVMTILTRLMSVLGPLIGGAIAFATNIQFVFMLAVGVMFLATIPLMLTPEPTKVRQGLTFKKFPWKTIKRDLVAQVGLASDQMTAVLIWPLFISLAVFEFDEAIYAKVGFVTSISLIIGVLMIKAMGRLVDNRRGKDLLHISTMVTALTHSIRPLVSTGLGVVLVNVLSEPAYNGTRIPFIKGLYDRADGFGDFRITYITVMQIAVACTRIVMISALWLLSMHLAESVVLQIGMLISAVLTSLVLFERFPAFKENR